MPQIFNQSVNTIFGGLKAKWPTLKTMAVLDWQTFPSDLPLDIWVDEYADYGKSESYDKPTPKETLRQNWLASKSNHQFWWCKCCNPLFGRLAAAYQKKRWLHRLVHRARGSGGDEHLRRAPCDPGPAAVLADGSARGQRNALLYAAAALPDLTWHVCH